MNQIRITKRKLDNYFEEIKPSDGTILRWKTESPIDIRTNVITIMKKRNHNKQTFYALETVIKLFGWKQITFKG